MEKDEIQNNELLGTTFEIKDEHKEAVQALYDQIEDANIAFNTASRNIRIAHRKFWETIRKLYPKLENFECSSKDLKISILNKIPKENN